MIPVSYRNVILRPNTNYYYYYQKNVCDIIYFLWYQKITLFYNVYNSTVKISTSDRLIVPVALLAPIFLDL